MEEQNNHGEQNQKPDEESLKNVKADDKDGDRKTSFIFGCVSLGAVFIALYLLKNLSPDQRFFYKILFALGCAGVAASLPGIGNLKIKKPYVATGAIVIFLIVINLKMPGRFMLTLFPESALDSGNLCIDHAKFKIKLDS
jgi:hypothetical protein